MPTETTKNSEESAARKTKPVKRRGPNALLIVIVILAGVAFYFYRQYDSLKSNPEAASADAADEVDRLVKEVSKYMVLPDETPTVATVTDISKLQNQAFFAKAKNGDKVLIFSEAKRAVIYDPVAKKIVEVAPINIGGGQGASSQTSVQSSPAPTPEPVETAPVSQESAAN